MEVEVTAQFGPEAHTRPANFIVLKFFLLGMLLSNGIESILIVPKTLSMMDDNEEQLQKLDDITQEHDVFKAQLNEYDRLVNSLREREHQEFELGEKNSLEEGIKQHNATHSVHGTLLASGKHAKGPPRKVVKPTGRPNGKAGVEEGVDTNKVIEVVLLMYGLITLAMGIYAVFKENGKLLIAFIAVVALGIVLLFFSGLTLLVFMSVLNDVIIALISFKYFQMINAPPCNAAYGGVPQQNLDGSYNVDLNSVPASNYR